MNNKISMNIETDNNINFNIERSLAGTSNYEDLTNKPSINNVELSGNKTSSNLGLQSEITNNNKLSSSLISGLSNVATSGSYNDLSNKPTIPTIPTNVSAFTNDVGYLTQHQDISGKLDTSKVKSTYSTTSGDVYDVSYINTMIGDIETLLGGI